MSLLIPPRRFDPAVPEMMDRPGQDYQLLKEDLAELQRINRALGGYRIPLRYLDQLLQRVSPPIRRFTVLDLATGAADVPRAIVTWAKQRSYAVEITAVDVNPDILRIAREHTVGWPDIRLEQQNLLALPYPPASFDIVLCALALHHFAAPDVIAILRRIHDIARVGYIVNDLRRNRTAIWLSRLMVNTVVTNPIARFDAPASCERAFAMDELRAMAAQAGMLNFRVRRHPVFRMALVGTN